MVHVSQFEVRLHWRLVLAFALLSSGVAVAQPAPLPTDLGCRWSAQLIATSPGVSDSYVVPFELEIKHTSSGLRAALLNGGDRVDFSTAVQHGAQVTLRMDQYDAVLSAHCTSGSGACRVLEGEYVRERGSSAVHYAVAARCLSPQRNPANSAISADSIAGDWQFAYSDSSSKNESKRSAPAHFSVDDQHVEGTIAPISGDYGMLSGTLASDGALHLSRFDGIHVLRLDGHFISPDRIEGVLHAAAGRPLDFVAIRSSAAQGFEAAEHLTSVENPTEPFRFHGVDASGATVTQDDPAFRGKVVLVDIFGTWCPNCHDEAPVLQSLYAKFHDRGFQIVGLSYEYVDDAARSQRLIGIYRRKYAITFPLLLVGTTDPGQIAKTLPQLRNFGAYPTTIFLDRHGRVRLIHAGFSGPATGRLNEVKQSFERTIVKLLDEP
jgi:thiol-disulfide isomerase/thioredoxin